jgi:hypothetical protein
MAPATNLLVFRDVSENIAGSALALRLREALSRIATEQPTSVLGALILAGELECALADSGRVSQTEAAAITDTLAHLALGSASVNLGQVLVLLSGIERSMPESVRISHPEGFAYYALHPADFANGAAGCVERGAVGVIGIRSIGTTLSAIARSVLARKGVSASRITIRPVGHPYDRKTEFANSQADWVEQHRQKGSTFLIVDEGPGLSGSSFLSVAEALEQHGVSSARITLLGTRDVDPTQLCARDAGQRWRRYRWKNVGSTIAEAYSDHLCLSGGSWRGTLLSPCAVWPACWPEMESLKFISRDRHFLFKFEGLGRHGERNRQRAEALFAAGFSPKPAEANAGMAGYEFVCGAPLSRSGVSTDVLDRIAKYCAFRAISFPATAASDQLTEMLRFNLSQQMGVELEVPAACLQSEMGVIPDCRMHPHEWIESTRGALVKVDGNIDGEGHFLPGPTDILWDVAGAIVEWNLNDDAERYLLAQLQKRAGRISQTRLPWFLLAYSVFRLSYCKMAQSSTQDTTEKPRLDEAGLYYKRIANSVLQKLSQAPMDSQLKI